jgi:hypothetical protein
MELGAGQGQLGWSQWSTWFVTIDPGRVLPPWQNPDEAHSPAIAGGKLPPKQADYTDSHPQKRVDGNNPIHPHF